MLYAVFTVMAAALLVLDQWFKFWVVENLPLGQSMPFLPGIMQLRTVHNYGAAWSSFSGMRWLLLAVTSLIVLAVLFVVVANDVFTTSIKDSTVVNTTDFSIPVFFAISFTISAFVIFLCDFMLFLCKIIFRTTNI